MTVWLWRWIRYGWWLGRAREVPGMTRRFLAFETGWEVVPLPQNGNTGRGLGLPGVGSWLKCI